MKILKCIKCNNVHLSLSGSAPVICCGVQMTELSANTTDAAKEKHVPEVKTENGKAYVQIGSVPHPVTEEHHIVFILLVQGNKTQIVNLAHTEPAKAEFDIFEGSFSVYEYCNLHGLWKIDL